jgi:hypothetical protein
MKDCVQRALIKDYANQNQSFKEFKVGDMELKRLGRWFMEFIFHLARKFI